MNHSLSLLWGRPEQVHSWSGLSHRSGVNASGMMTDRRKYERRYSVHQTFYADWFLVIGEKPELAA